MSALTPAPEAPAAEEDFGNVAKAMERALFKPGSKSRFFEWVAKAEKRLGTHFTVPDRKGLYDLRLIREAMKPTCLIPWEESRTLTNRRRNAR